MLLITANKVNNGQIAKLHQQIFDFKVSPSIIGRVNRIDRIWSAGL